MRGDCVFGTAWLSLLPSKLTAGETKVLTSLHGSDILSSRSESRWQQKHRQLQKIWRRKWRQSWRRNSICVVIYHRQFRVFWSKSEFISHYKFDRAILKDPQQRPSLRHNIDRLISQYIWERSLILYYAANIACLTRTSTILVTVAGTWRRARIPARVIAMSTWIRVRCPVSCTIRQ